MALTKPTFLTNIITSLATTSAERALTETAFKMKFDETVTAIKAYIVDVLTVEVDTALGLKSPLASPTFTGTVVLPSTTSIGNVSNTELGYLDNVTSSIQTQINNTTLVSSVAVTASKTLALTDVNTLQADNHATVAIVNTIPPNSSVAFPIGTQIAFSRDGVADVSVALGAGVTITNTTKLKIANQGESMALLKTGTDTWKLFGSLKA